MILAAYRARVAYPASNLTALSLPFLSESGTSACGPRLCSASVTRHCRGAPDALDNYPIAVSVSLASSFRASAVGCDETACRFAAPEATADRRPTEIVLLNRTGVAGATPRNALKGDSDETRLLPGGAAFRSSGDIALAHIGRPVGPNTRRCYCEDQWQRPGSVLSSHITASYWRHDHDRSGVDPVLKRNARYTALFHCRACAGDGLGASAVRHCGYARWYAETLRPCAAGERGSRCAAAIAMQRSRLRSAATSIARPCARRLVAKPSSPHFVRAAARYCARNNACVAPRAALLHSRHANDDPPIHYGCKRDDAVLVQAHPCTGRNARICINPVVVTPVSGPFHQRVE